ncbi:MAG: 3-dehydroquinate synthase [Chlorobi bacterium]|nr:3-dehydroquinate synthase [Chlorobiota bacterium]
MIPLLSKEANIYISEDLKEDIGKLISTFPKDKIFVLTDEGSHKHCLPKIFPVAGISEDNVLVIPQGDKNKNIETLQKVWHFLSHSGADRKSLLINLGGGMPCDLGGFAASTFKRGIQFINVPTTLLAQVDASIGGKTGVNFEGFKNEIGVFNQASAVLIDTSFFDTLDTPNIVSGYAEMIKHALIYSKEAWDKLTDFDIYSFEKEELKSLVANSIMIKNHFVQNDPTEQFLRKALNFGHTFGHAFESFAMHEGKPVLHGYAVAYGMICELYLSHLRLGFKMADVIEISNMLKRIFGIMPITSDDYEELLRLMTHDKKNEDNRINFTLLEDIGEMQVNINASESEVIAAFEFYRDLCENC